MICALLKQYHTTKNTNVKNLNDRMLQNKMVLNANKSMVIVIDNSKQKKYSNIDIVINGEKSPL